MSDSIIRTELANTKNFDSYSARAPSTSMAADIPRTNTARRISQAAGPSKGDVRVPASKKRSLDTEDSATEDDATGDAPAIKRRKTINTSSNPTNRAAQPSFAKTTSAAAKAVKDSRRFRLSALCN